MQEEERVEGGLPELVPARMVNEFTYCSRLFHLKWVSRQWAGNDDTVEGDYAHRNVDKPIGRVLDAGVAGDMKARSVPVSSQRLGLTAVLDVLEGSDGRVRPVDTKKGAPPDNRQRSCMDSSERQRETISTKRWVLPAKLLDRHCDLVEATDRRNPPPIGLRRRIEIHARWAQERKEPEVR